MKNYIKLFFSSLVIISGLLKAQNFSSNQSYTYSRSYLEPVSYTDSNLNTKKQVQSVQYTDGLGRPKQDIAIGATYNGNDLVTTYFYDPVTGRQSRQYLPVTKASTTGALQTVSEADINSYYGVTNAFSEIKTENSPLDRPVETAAPGDAWQMSGGKTKKMEYLFNGLNEVKKYTAVTDDNENVFEPALAQAGFYGQNQLHKIKSTDEDGNVSVVYKNPLGQTLMTRQENGTQKLDTYYIYNQYGQMVLILPPKASAVRLTQTVKDELCYIYRYDAKGRLIEKKLPGKDKEEMVYDKTDRLILYRDAKIRAQDKWLITKYDVFGRVLYTGFVYGEGRASLQNVIADLAITESPDSTGFTRSGMQIYYTQYYFGYADTILSVNYYDQYPAGAPAKPVLITEAALSSDNLAAQSTKSMPTASYVKNISDSYWTKTYYWYDQRGRSIGAMEINHLGGATITHTELDWAGITQKVETQHQRTAIDASVHVKERFVYNSRNYLEEHYHQVNNRPEELLAKYTYNDLGQVTNKQVGNNLQSIDYSYNVRGWLTHINNTNTLGNKLFAYKINYNERDGLETPNLDYPDHKVMPRYNGNITEVAWKAVDIIDEAPAATPQRQGFVYDKANRLLAGFYQMPDNPAIKANSEIIEEYDPNGNILGLKRTGNLQKGRVKMMDNLTYTVEGNRITSVTDAANNQTGYEGGGGAITYDANGNMTAMADKGISNISYNFLNLPEVITQTNVVSYSYRADGVKLKKKLVLNNGAGTNTINTEYLDGFVYTTTMIAPLREALNRQEPATIATRYAGQEEIFTAPEETPLLQQPGDPQSVSLAYFPTAEGYYDYQNNLYIYQYKDHLGNVRLSYVRNPDTSSIEILDRNDYYAFGMNMYEQNSVYDASGTPLNNKYNGKELQETGFYDYGWRQYMPDLGRWFGMDQLSETYSSFSPYAYVMNNPIMMYDPDGRWSEGYQDSLNNPFENAGWRPNHSLEPNHASSNYWGMSNIYDKTTFKLGGYDYTSGTRTSTYSYLNPGNVTGFYNPSINGYELEDPGITFVKTSWGQQSRMEELKWLNQIDYDAIKKITDWKNFSIGLQTQYMEYAVRHNYKSANSWLDFNKLRKTQQEWRTINTLGKEGAQILKVLKVAGNVATIATTGYSLYNAGNYWYKGGRDSSVYIKTGLDLVMTGVGFLGPIGFSISATYFVVDAATGGFGGYGKIPEN